MTASELKQRYPNIAWMFCENPAPFNRERAITEALENGNGDISFMFEPEREREPEWKQLKMEMLMI